MIKIYFAGSIRGGRDDALWYAELMSSLRKHGKVLSEHVARPDVHAQERRLTERQIFQQDLRWLREADAIVAEVTTPSLGVGYELGFAEALKIPALCLFQEDVGRSLSAMIKGSLYYENNIVGYKKGDMKTVERIITHFFKTSVLEQAEVVV
jgi:nucleoside 2-deoxyribosyltransferase